MNISNLGMSCPLWVCTAALSMTMGCAASNDVIREIKSPSGTYTALVFGDPSTPTRPFPSHHVWATLTSSTRVWKDVPVHTSGWMDSGFDARFQNVEWPAENVLRFVGLPESRSESSSIVVQNLSSRRVDCLRVHVSDLFLVLGLEPASKVAMSATTPLGNATAYMEVAEVSANGLLMRQTDKDFSRSKPRAPVHYTVVIRDSGIELHAEQ